MSEISKLDTKIVQKFNRSIRLLLIESKLFGLIILNVTNFQNSFIHILFNVVSVVIYSAIIFYGLYKLATASNILIYKATDIIIMEINAVYVCTSWICAITKKQLFLDFLQRICEFDTKLKTIGIRINYEKYKRRILKQILFRFVCIIINVGSLLIMALMMDSDLFIESIGYFLIIINSIICQQASELALMIKMRFVILNKQIEILINFFATNNMKSVKNRNKKTLSILNKICALHHHLSKTIKLFNEIFGLVLLLMFGVSFIVIVITCFYFTAFIQIPESSLITLIVPILTNLSFVVNAFHICNVSFTTIEEVNRSIELIHKIDTEDHYIRDEIEMFSLQIANEQLEFNAAGFFTIDHSLIFSIIGGVTTYIIILIQLAASLAG